MSEDIEDFGHTIFSKRYMIIKLKNNVEEVNSLISYEKQKTKRNKKTTLSMLFQKATKKNYSTDHN